MNMEYMRIIMKRKKNEKKEISLFLMGAEIKFLRNVCCLFPRIMLRMY